MKVSHRSRRLLPVVLAVLLVITVSLAANLPRNRLEAAWAGQASSSMLSLADPQVHLHEMLPLPAPGEHQ